MLSIIIPFYNEKDSLPILLQKLTEKLKGLKERYEIILVNDGSTDNFNSNIKYQEESIKLFSHRKRMGKGQSLITGFKNSSGETVVFMDADLQDDPSELSKFIEKINNGYDFVNGWRKIRKDSLLKTLPSSIFNFFLLKLFLQSKYHDINCGYKAMRRKVLEEIPLYGDNYRFLPLLAEKQGFKTTEVIVVHHRRKYGYSKYGFLRLVFGLFDTLTTYFVYEFSEKPLHFFGPIGGLIFLIGFIITGLLGIQRLFFGILLYQRPLLFLGMLLIIVGIQILMTGIIGELIVYLNKKKN